MIGLVNKLFAGRSGGWRLAMGASVGLHGVSIIWLLWAADLQPPAQVRQPVQGKPVIAEAVDPAWAEQELERLDQLKTERAQQLEAERQKVKQLEKEKAREQAARKAAEKEKAESERRLAEARKQKAARAAEQRKAAEKQRERELEAQREKLKQEKAREAQAARERAEKAAAEKRAAEKLAAEQEQKRLAELARQEAAREEESRRQEIEAQRLRKERQQAQESLQRQLASEQAALDAGIVQQYIAAIQGRVTNNWLRPLNWSAEARCDVSVKLIPGGEVIAAQVVGSCGSAAFDRSVEAAVVKASPLPVPEEPRLFNDNFRSFTFVFRNDG